MNGSTIQPERAWQMALDQLRLDMPKASFDTWARVASFVSFEDGIFTVGTPNEYGREWLARCLASTIIRLLTGISNQQMEVQFVVVEEVIEDEINEPHEDENCAPVDGPSVLSLQVEYQSIYDEIGQPDHFILVPGDFMRILPLLGMDLIWLYIGLRQASRPEFLYVRFSASFSLDQLPSS